MTLQFGASLTDDTRSVNYNHNTFLIQAVTGPVATARLEPLTLSRRGNCSTSVLMLLRGGLSSKKVIRNSMTSLVIKHPYDRNGIDLEWVNFAPF